MNDRPINPSGLLPQQSRKIHLYQKRGFHINILHLLQYFKIGGKEEVVKNLILRSTKRSNPMACALRKIGFFASEVKKEGFEVKLIDTTDKKKNTINVINELINILKEYQIDVLHCHDIGSWYYGVIAGRLSKVKKIIFTRHSFLEDDSLRVLLLSKLLSLFTDKIVAVSPEIKCHMIKKEYINKNKIETIYNGIDLEKYQIELGKNEIRSSLNIDKQAFVLGTVTRFYKVKNIEMQIDMVDLLKDRIPNLKHLIVAPLDRYGEKIKQDIENRKLENYILLLGFREDVPELLKAMDVFILTSFSEGMSLALLEAMASKCTIVASAVGGNVRLVDHMRNGILFDVHKLKELCDFVLALYSDPHLKVYLSEMAFTSVKKFSVEAMVQRYESLYLGL